MKSWIFEKMQHNNDITKTGHFSRNTENTRQKLVREVAKRTATLKELTDYAAIAFCVLHITISSCTVHMSRQKGKVITHNYVLPLKPPQIHCFWIAKYIAGDCALVWNKQFWEHFKKLRWTQKQYLAPINKRTPWAQWKMMVTIS